MTDKRLRWRLADLIDYECFLVVDEKRASADLDRRDHALYRDAIKPALPPATAAHPERQAVLRHWVEARRSQESRCADSTRAEAVMPGEAFGEVTKEVVVVLALLAAGVGWWIATAGLAYSSGAEPINACAFFVEFGATQMVILVMAAAVFAARWWFPQWRIPSLLRYGLRVVFKAAMALWRWWRQQDPERYQNARAMHGVLRARHSLYQGVLVWSAVGLAQLLVISFNGGVLGAMAARHLFHDLDFGWESTWLDAGQVARGVRLIALPWSWAVRPGYPDPSQVAGSQNHKRDNGHLDAASLKSWSQFLFGAVICYGLLPRAFLLFLAIRKQRTILDRLDFNDGRSELLWLRLLTPTVDIPGQEHQVDPPPVASPAPIGVLSHPNRPVLRTEEPAAFSTATPAPVLNLTGLALTSDQVMAALPLGHRMPPIVFEVGTVSAAEESLIFAQIGRSASPAGKVFVLVPSWQPPVVAFTSSLDQMRACLEIDKLISVILIGEPGPDDGFEPAQQADRQDWIKAIQARGDPYMNVIAPS